MYVSLNHLVGFSIIFIPVMYLVSNLSWLHPSPLHAQYGTRSQVSVYTSLMLTLAVLVLAILIFLPAYFLSLFWFLALMYLICYFLPSSWVLWNISDSSMSLRYLASLFFFWYALIAVPSCHWY